MKRILIVVILGIVTLSMTAQETKVFILDLGNPSKNSLTVKGKSKKSKALEIRTNQLLILELVNANPFKYNYKISNNPINFFDVEQNPFKEFQDKARKVENSASPNKELSDGKIKVLENNLLEPLSKNSIDKNQLIQLFSLFTEQAEQFLQSKKDAIISSLNHMNDVKLDKLLKVENIQIPMITNDQLEKYTDEFTQSRQSSFVILDNQKARKTGEVVVTSQLRDDIKETASVYLEVLKTLEKQEELIKTYVEEALFELTVKMESTLSDIEKYKKKISVNDFLNKDDFLKQREKFFSRMSDIVESVKYLNEEVSKSSVKDIVLEYNKGFPRFSKGEEKVRNLLSTLYEKKLDYHTMPIDFNGDNVDAMQIKVSRTLLSDTSKSEDFTYNIWVKGGVKIDFSAGVYFSSLVNHSYGKKNITINENGTELTRQMIFEKDANRYQNSFGSTLNISPRLGASWVKPTLSFGAILANNENLQLMTGIGIHLGKKQRILLQVGTVMGNVIRLANNYNLTDTFEIPGGDDTIPTTQKFDFGHFFGISYNLGKKPAENNN